MAIFVLWRRPEAWHILNRYFLQSVGHPNAFSVLGSAFSHQQFGHLARNTALLFLVGIPVHEELGRGTFIGLYLISAVSGSLLSLTFNVLTKNILSASVGASSAIYGLIGAYFVTQEERRLGFEEWSATYDGRIGLATVVAWELYCWRRSGWGRVVEGSGGGSDHANHLGGVIAGAAVGWWIRMRAEESRRTQDGLRMLVDGAEKVERMGVGDEEEAEDVLSKAVRQMEREESMT